VEGNGKAPTAHARLAELLERGDHAAARAEVRRILRVPDSNASEADQAAARQALSRLRPDRAALLAGAVAAAVLLAALFYGVLR
jgi:hypothetical protein